MATNPTFHGDLSCWLPIVLITAGGNANRIIIRGDAHFASLSLHCRDDKAPQADTYQIRV